MKPLAIASFALSMISPIAATAADPIEISRAEARKRVDVPAQNFTGVVQLEMLFLPNAAQRTSAGSVSFAPAARTNWHTHPLGQTLVVTSGVGRVQHWGGSIEEIRPGDVVRIPPGVKHWHGAAPDSAMTHLAIQEQENGKSADWMEKVSDEQYYGEQMPAPKSAASQPSRAQQLMGDVAPKLAELTDTVLFGDVWSRPGLSPRDRSLVTISALVAMNRPDQLRSHLALGRKNGLTQVELVEAITQLAFYSGWPNAVTAVGVAREVFKTTP